MNTAGDENDLGRFLGEDDDGLRPIDMPVSSQETPEPKTAPPTPGASPEAAKHMFNNEKNRAKKGDYIDLLKKDPTLSQIIIAAGWDQKAVEEEPADVDLSVFLLDKDNKTRVDEDFIFYNNPEGCEGAVRHMSDSRTGAGEGDDECVTLDIKALPFDILRIAFVLSIYDEEARGRHFGQVRNVFLRLVNQEDGHEILRFTLDENEYGETKCVLVAALVREGPKWYFEALGTPSPKSSGLDQLATGYGIIVRELQSTG